MICAVKSTLSSIAFDALIPPPLPPRSDSSFNRVLDAKIKICSEMCDFSAPEDPRTQLKRDTLAELANLLCTGDYLAIPIHHIQSLYAMACLNVLREDPVFPTFIETVDWTVPVVEPAMFHLSICYRILSRIIDGFPEASFITFSLVNRLFVLTQLPDARERGCIVDLLKRYYSVHVPQQVQFLRSLTVRFITVVDQNLTPWSVIPLIMVFIHCFNTCIRIYRQDLANLVINGIVPLATHDSLAIFLPSFKIAMFQVIAPAMPEAISALASRLQKTWPLLSGKREVCYVDLLITLAPFLPQTTFACMSRTYFSFLAYLLESPNYMVLLHVMSMFERHEWLPLIQMHKVLVIERLYLVFRGLDTHWNFDVRENSQKIVSMFDKDSRSEVAKLKQAIARKRANSGDLQPDVEEVKRVQAWSRLIMANAPDPIMIDMIQEAANPSRKKQLSHFMKPDEQPILTEILGLIAPDAARTFERLPGAQAPLPKKSMRSSFVFAPGRIRSVFG
jgi:hypothetical protein